MIQAHFKSLQTKINNNSHRYLLLIASLVLVTCCVTFLPKSAILFPVTIGTEILLKMIVGNFMEKWVGRIKQKILNSITG